MKLKEIAHFLSKFAEKSDNVYWLSSSNLDQIAYISPAFEKIWGRPVTPLYSNPDLWITYLHPKDIKDHHPIHEFAERVKQLGPHARYEENYRIVRPDGEIRWILDRGFPLYTSSGKCYGVSGVAIDITKEKQIEETLRNAKEAAEAANKAKTEFLQNIRHDIRTPLNGIIGFAGLIKEETKNKKIFTYADYMLTSSNALLNLLNNIIDAIDIYDDAHPVVKKKFSLQNLIEQIIQLNQAAAKRKNLIFTFSYDKNIPTYLIGNVEKIQKIFIELTANAINFTHHGSIEFNATLVSKQGKEVIVKVEIKDTGIGIPPHQTTTIFGNFNRLHPTYLGTYKGLGLGLSLVKKLIEDIGGEIYLESKLNEGSVFSCLFPLRQPLTDDDFGVINLPHTTNNIVAAKKITAPFANKTCHALLIEDEAISAFALTTLLNKFNCKVTHAKNGKTAIENFKKNHFDLIFIAAELPDGTADQIAKKIRSKKNSSHIPIILLTSNPKNNISPAIDTVMTKPISLHSIENLLKQLIIPCAA